MTTQTDLKPCPFCGGQVSIQTQFSKDYWVQCDDLGCGASDGKLYPNEQEAIAAWNRRSECQQASTPVGEVGKVIMFGGDCKEVAWAKGKMPPVGTKLYAAPLPLPAPPIPSNSGELEALPQQAAQQDRLTLQAEGKHPAPCARHCEATAFNIEIRRLKGQIDAQQAAQQTEQARDWTEDFRHENGNYACICTTCRNQFQGHKRRVICKVCAAPSAAPVQAEQPALDKSVIKRLATQTGFTLKQETPDGSDLKPYVYDFAQAIASYLAAAAPVQAATVDWLGLALDLEQQAKRVESQTVERAMLAAANGLRLMNAGAPAQTEQPNELRLLKAKAEAYDEWQEKTDWVQKQNSSFSFIPLGMHRADVMRKEIEMLRAAAAPVAQDERKLCQFYDVNTLSELVAEQARHIEKLQAKLPATTIRAEQRVREG